MEKPCNSTSGTTDETGNNPPLPIRNPVLSPGFRSVDRTIEEFRMFKRSAAPRRFLFFEDNSWLDIPDQVFDDLSAGFIAGKTTLEVPVDGNRYIFDFLRMTRIDSSTGARNSIAWIDVEGRCFFPKTAVEEQRKRKRDSGEDSEVSSAPNLDRTKWAGGERLGDDDRFYRVVERSFVAGMRRAAAAEATVTAVTRCSYSGPLGISRLRGFQMMVQGTKAARGNANVRFGWYGGSVDAIAGVVEHGFGVSDSRDSGFGSRGVGVHLSPPHSPFTSSLQSRPDDDGEKHILLCRVIMGNSERVEDGSPQYRPSSSEFDSGVDDLVSPKCYVVWSTHMNTHILPEYIVSFRSPNQAQGLWGAVGSQRRLAAAAGLSFRDLFAELGRSLPPPSMQALESLYNQHKGGTVSKDAFIRYLRSVAGDDLLTSAIKGFRGHQYDVKRVKRY